MRATEWFLAAMWKITPAVFLLAFFGMVFGGLAALACDVAGLGDLGAAIHNTEGAGIAFYFWRLCLYSTVGALVSGLGMLASIFIAFAGNIRLED